MTKLRTTPVIHQNDKLKTCLKNVLNARFIEMVSFEQQVISGNDINALHDMRVSGRRVQTILKVFRSCFPREGYKSQYPVIRTLIRSLGRVREYDVFIDMLETHMKSLRGNNRMTLEVLRQRFIEQRNNERKELQWTLRLFSQIQYKENFLRFVKNSL